MSVYLVGAIDVHDHEVYKKYSEGAREALSIVPFEMLSGDSQPRVLEGAQPAGKLFIFKFNSHEDVDKFFKSEAYQKVIGYRHSASDTRFLMAMQGAL
jgi:uncharacterized protein (DUF1330 family)